jgi:hypothetical protein
MVVAAWTTRFHFPSSHVFSLCIFHQKDIFQLSDLNNYLKEDKDNFSTLASFASFRLSHEGYFRIEVLLTKKNSSENSNNYAHSLAHNRNKVKA